MATVNGEKADCVGKTIAQLLEDMNYERQRVAVELNGEILPKAEYDSTAVKENDCIEVVSFVGGG